MTLLLLGVACGVESGDSPDTGDRQPLGKADAIGSCEDHCGGKSDGNCWCDDLCEGFGDCCEDYGEQCLGEEEDGCLSSSECGDGEYCAFEAGTCGEGGAGSCAPRPDACIQLFDPVCGCDGETYGNACGAASAGVSVQHAGECEEEGDGCLSNAECGDGEFCAFEVGTCGEGGEGDCAPRPEACIQIFDPVCGCDGETYGNACTARSAGVSVQHDGECAVENDDSCDGHCGGKAPGGCWCDDLCEGFGDCCDDKADECDGPTCSDQGDSCAGGETCCDGLQCCSGIPVPVGQEFCGQVCPISDRNKKEHFAKIDNASILAKVAGLPITTWNYKFQDDAVRHLGPMAQDFKAAFGLGSTDKSIFTIDADGVALASIQALKAENDALKQQLTQLEKRLAKLEK